MSNLFVHTLLPKLQTKNGNRLEYVKHVILTERIQPGSNNRGEKHTVLLLVLGRHNVTNSIRIKRTAPQIERAGNLQA